ncbi:MAG: carbohydrate-binding family 9-like protein [Clostridiaceae bacterium]|nr:carbohydrate-binding family 9-like protein [Clostridiaceae bacterium]
MQYVIHKTDDIARMEEGRIALAPWGAEYRPDARFYIGWQDDRLIVHLRAYEVNPVADVTERNGNVCCDSCLEFFFSPSADNSAGYFNFEMNANPTLLLHYGLVSKHTERFCVDWPLEAFRLTVTRDSDACSMGGGVYWQANFIVPLDMVRRYVPGASFEKGQILRANLYKCGSTRQVSHYLTWAPFDTADVPRPDFHVPRYFGEMLLSD